MMLGHLSLCSQVLLQPLGVPPTPQRQCFTFSHSEDSLISSIRAQRQRGHQLTELGFWSLEKWYKWE